MILEEVRKNKISSFFIVSIFIIVIMIGVYAICMYFDLGSLSIVFALTFSIVPSLISYYNCDKMVLALNGARPATQQQDLLIDSILENLCIASGLPKPKLYVIQDNALNAFATGRNPQNAVICLTTGIIEKLNKYELEGVIAHELSHIKNYDILLSTVVSVFVGLVVILSDFLSRWTFFRGSKNRDNNNNGGDAIIALIAIIFIIISPIFATLMQLAISRKREYLADSSAVEITRNPDGLINALIKISSDPVPLKNANKSTAHLFISNPFKEKRSRDNIMSTHPSIENRINALRNIK